jgi:hypothetical protein
MGIRANLGINDAMAMDYRAGLAGGIAGFCLGVLVSGTTVGVFAYSSTRPSLDGFKPHPSPAPSADQVKKYTHRIILPAVKSDEMDHAIATMGLPPVEQHQVREDLENRNYRLVWLTLWDWDASGDKGDTISISSDAYRRLFTLHSRRATVAIPEPKSGYIELRGEQSEDGIIAISLLSGAQPLAVPRMSLGQSVKIEIDTP